MNHTEEGSESSAEEAAMRLAFQQFMMTGRHAGDLNNNNNNNNPQQNFTPPNGDITIPQNQQLQQQGQLMKKAEKRYRQIFQNFAIMVRDEWLKLDDEAYRIVEAISHVRSRLTMEARLLSNTFQQLYHHQQHHHHHQQQTSDWACHAYQPSTLNITCQDVNLALGHDLQQHEQLMGGLRGVFASISECHESLMRQMDIMMKHHLECCKEFHTATSTVTTNQNTNTNTTTSLVLGKAANLIEIMTCILEMLSQELYRKQCLVHMILQSVNDNNLLSSLSAINENGNKSGLVEHIDEAADLEDSTAMPIADVCRKKWSREDPRHGCVDSEVLNKFLKLLA
mmetsp:Transcript_7338/g.13913  ORF Transcript_7338/g.13913 Transcript_7338/m.13913 type:complete len:339 (+) Transcript_7338:873-1889(+)